MNMKSVTAFAIAFGICIVLFFILDVALFNAQGLSFAFKG